MSSLEVRVVQIDKLEKHPNADRLEIAYIDGYQVVVGKGEHVQGGLAVYIPIDSVLPEDLEQKILGDSKIKLSNHRVKTVKIRSAYSQGMLVAPRHLGLDRVVLGADLTDKLGITKYEPPVKSTPQSNANQVKRRDLNPNFRKYTDIENLQRHINLFQPLEMVYVLEKIHGSNFRAGYVKSVPRTFWQKILKFFGKLPEYEFVYGSHNVQLQDKPKFKDFYKTKGIFKSNIYLDMVEKYDLRTRIPHGYVVYGEVYGDQVQPNFGYGCQPGERKLAIFDVMSDGLYMDHAMVMQFGIDWGLPLVPVDGYMQYSETTVKHFADHPSWLAPNHPREGVVIKPVVETLSYVGRKILKYKSPAFLEKFEDNTH